MTDELAGGRVLRELRDELNECNELISELRQERKSLRNELTAIAIDFRVAKEDLASKQRLIDSLMAELRK